MSSPVVTAVVPGRRYPALLMGAVLAVGILAADHLDTTPVPWFWMVGGAGVLLLASILNPRSGASLLRVLTAVIFLFGLGGLRLAVSHAGRPSPVLAELSKLGGSVELYGKLAGVPERRASGWRVPLDAGAARRGHDLLPLCSRLLLTSRRSLREFRYADQVKVRVRLYLPPVKRNPGGFDYAEYLFRKGIDGLARTSGPVKLLGGDNTSFAPANLVEPVRRWVRTVSARFLPASARALLLGFLLGDTDLLDRDIFQAFRRSGTLHLLAVSGANVWLIVGMVLLPLRFAGLSRWLRTAIILAVIVGFSFLTRNEPSVVRASLMVATLVIGRLLFRYPSALNSVGVAGVCILLVAPDQLFRPGFQLSFAAVIAIILMATRVSSWAVCRRLRSLRWVLLTSSSSVAATVATAPIIAWHFGTVPLASLPANLVMIPIATLALDFGVGVLFLGELSDVIAAWLAVPAEFFLNLCAEVARLFASIPGSVITWPDPSPWGVGLLYAMAGLGLRWQHRYRWMRPAVAVATVGLLVAAVSQVAGPASPAITIAALDAGSDPVVLMYHARSDTVRSLTGNPGDESLRQWVIDPFIRRQFRNDLSLSDARPMVGERSFEIPPDSALLGGAGDIHPVWRRIRSRAGATDKTPGLTLDQIVWGRDTVVVVSGTVSRSAVDSIILARDALSSGRLMILPISLPRTHLRHILDSSAVPWVVFCGRRNRGESPFQELMIWRTHYPQKQFWLTSVHGGVMMAWCRTGLTLHPTIPEIIWRDTDFQ